MSDFSAQSAVGVLVVGHGATASRLLSAALDIAPAGTLTSVEAVDAGPGESPEFARAICQGVLRVDHGRGVVVMVDLLGASPCTCAQQQGGTHDLIVLSGLNLAMLLKLASLNLTRLTAREVADACAESARRAVAVSTQERIS